MEGVQHIDGSLELGHVNGAIRARFIANANLVNAPTVDIDLKLVGSPLNCTRISSKPMLCRRASGIARKSSRLDPRNSSGFIPRGAVVFLGLTMGISLHTRPSN
jgi:hypothetical protein